MPRDPVLMGMRADSFVHVGIGQSFGEVDLPFVREAATHYPFIPGSAMKGALRRAYWEKHPFFKLDQNGVPTDEPVPGLDERVIFGHSDDAAGVLLVGDARLVFLPVRSLGKSFRYLTCPTLLSRVLRDLGRCSNPASGTFDPFAVAPDDVKHAVCVMAEAAPLFLEEFPFTADQAFDEEATTTLGHILDALITAAATERSQLLARIVLVNDDALEAFARHALPVRMRNKLNEDKLVVPGALWSEEYLPPETLLYAVLADRRPANADLDPLQHMRDLLTARRGYLQIGGNETVGQGLFQFRMPQGASS